MNQPLDSSESLVIMVDHSNQIGTEKVMLALGVNAAAMPEPGKALTHEHVRVLEVKPLCRSAFLTRACSAKWSSTWKRNSRPCFRSALYFVVFLSK
jgi:hypothetical protein